MDRNETNIGRWADDRLASLRPSQEWRPDASRGLSLLRKKKAADGLRARQRAWTAGAVIAVCIGMLAFPVTRAFAQHCVNACVGETTRVGGFLFRGFSLHTSPGHTSADSGAAEPGLKELRFTAAGDRKIAPDFELSDASGKAVKLSDFRGQVVLLNFWATWCVPCRTEIPWFVEFQRTYRGSNFTVLGVSFDDDGRKAVKPYMEAQKMNYPIAIGNDNVSAAYGGVTSLPATLFIDKLGRIASAHIGLCGKNDYRAEIETLLDE